MKRNDKHELSPITTAWICLLAMGVTILAACVRNDDLNMSDGVTESTVIEATDEDMTSETIPAEDMVSSNGKENAKEENTEEKSPFTSWDTESLIVETEPSSIISSEALRDKTTTSETTKAPETKKSETTNPEITKAPETKKPETTKPTSPETEPLLPSSSISEYERRVAELINKIRRQNGVNELMLNETLCDTAREKSRDMKSLGYFDHTSPTYGSPFDMMKRFGITYRVAGENIAMGYRTPEAVVEGWMSSEGHRANILNAAFTEIGMGYVAEGHYWTQMFIG